MDQEALDCSTHSLVRRALGREARAPFLFLHMQLSSLTEAMEEEALQTTWAAVLFAVVQEAAILVCTFDVIISSSNNLQLGGSGAAGKKLSSLVQILLF